jgi:hypothetical protein
MHTASAKPVPTRMSDAPMCRHSVPFASSSIAPVTTPHGVGNMRLCVAMIAAHQVMSSATMTPRAGRLLLILFIVF